MSSVSHHLVFSSPQVIHSLRASNRAFADVSNPTGYWDCLDFCTSNNVVGWKEDECEAVCDAMSDEDYGCIFRCHQNPNKPFGACNCECTNHCIMVGPGRYITSGPTPLYTRPPRSPEPSTTSMPSLSPAPAPNNQRSGNASDNANENAHNQVGIPKENSSEATDAPRESPLSSDFNDTVE